MKGCLLLNNLLINKMGYQLYSLLNYMFFIFFISCIIFHTQNKVEFLHLMIRHFTPINEVADHLTGINILSICLLNDYSTVKSFSSVHKMFMYMP